MANRRMFSTDIVSSDAFLDMGSGAQLLYFHLAMRADDDGFVNPKAIMRMVGAAEDDLKVLLAKRFLLTFDIGVVVIKHWLIHNLIRADLYKETTYKKEKSTLGLNENGSYTELKNDKENVHELKKIDAPKWLKLRKKSTYRKRTANVPQTARRIGKDRIGEDSEIKDNNTLQLSVADPVNKLFEVFQMSVNPTINYANKTQRKAAQQLIDDLTEEKAMRLAQYACSIQGQDFAPIVTTPYQLKEKSAQIRIYWQKENNKQKIETKGITI